jgi:hypothetical protein
MVKASSRSPGGLSSENGGGTTDCGAVVLLLGALIDGEGGTELELIARQMDLAMFFAMNEFGPLSGGRRFSPPVSCERGRKQR